MTRKTFPLFLLLLAALTAVALTPAAPATAAHPDFLEADVTVLASFTAEAPGDFYGFVGAAIGDLDGDGASEYVIGAPGNNGFAGKSYVYDGATGALLHTVAGNPAELMGFSVAGGGDADGDGVPDYATGGRGFASIPGRVVLLSGADHSVIRDYVGLPGSFFGYDLGFAGDVDGDGLDDLIVGARFAASGAGRVAVFSSADGALLWDRIGEAGDSLGSAVSGLGDLNGDGVPEQGAGASLRTKQIGNFTRTGVARVFDGASGADLHLLEPRPTAGAFGNFFVHDAGDVDRDGVSDVYVGDFADAFSAPGAGAAYLYSGASGEILRFLAGESAGDGYGIGRGAGDVDGDGFPDQIIGAYLSDAGAPNGGKCYVVSGKNGKDLRTYTGTVGNGQLGFDALALGDVNADGLTDYLLTGFDLAWVVAGTAH